VFSVNTEGEAESLIVLSAPLGYDGKRHGVPAILRADEYDDLIGAPMATAMMESLERVSNHLAEWYGRLKPKERTPA